jgi:hypothetical protein
MTQIEKAERFDTMAMTATGDAAEMLAEICDTVDATLGLDSEDAAYGAAAYDLAAAAGLI